MLKKDEIIREIIKTKPEFEAIGINILGLFGSYAKDTPTEMSDIDILIETTSYFLIRSNPPLPSLSSPNAFIGDP